MKILLVSDSHGHNEILKNLVRQYPNMNFYFHAGDSQSSPYEIAPFISVKGNCDYDEDFMDHIKINTPYGNLYMAHKPLINPNIIKENDIKILINGHTHVPQIKKVEDLYILNPGSVVYPRSGNSPSYMIIDIEKDKIDAKIIYF